jgi:hypothetical protein
MKFQLADYSKLEAIILPTDWSVKSFQPSAVSPQERHFHGVAAGQFSLRAIRRTRFAFLHSGEE